ncbi:hypothetical protein BGZ93_010249 [Podila epicladia]|nr:hypothetical protein BGZ92_010185 [Podila epicladia]KAG0088774.1 hypothetical protein BGZ93_010249 [Podila epicladia]
MFRLVNKRLAASKELESLKQDFNQCSLPIEFVYRIVVSCVDEIMERGLNHPFILRNPYSPSVVAAMLTLMADPERRHYFSLKCMRIDTVAGVMLAVLKNLREAIVPMEIQDELTSGKYFDAISITRVGLPFKNISQIRYTGGFSNSGTSTPTTPPSRPSRTSSSHSINKINTVNSLLNHSQFPAVNRALLMELLNLSLAILNRSSFNRVKPDMLATILGPHIFASQHATILQHTPQQAYSFGWGVALVNDIKRCSKMFYVLLGGYRREVLGPEEWEYDHALSSATSVCFTCAPQSAVSSRGQVNQWLGSTSECGSPRGGLRDPHSRFGMVRISTTLSESIRAQAAQEARLWKLDQSGSGSKGPAALEHLRGHTSNWSSRQRPYRHYGGHQGITQQHQQQHRRYSSGVERRQDPIQNRVRRNDPEESVNELEHVFRRHKLHQQDKESHVGPSISQDDGGEPSDGLLRQKEQKRQAIEQMIRECRGAGLNFAVRESGSETPVYDRGLGQPSIY